MIIQELIRNINPLQITGELNQDITSIVYDSRQVKEGSLFICIKGFKLDGHDFIDKAIQNGAVAILIEKELSECKKGITYIQVEDSRKSMADLAATFYNYPQEKLNLIGVTGTNGKTTTTYLIKAILDQAGFKTGLIGTIKNIIGGKTLPATRTTPESLDLYELYDRMLKEGVSHVVMEVSSHALDLKRVAGMKFSIGIFTNITQDHLDYHKSFAEYLKAKTRLFSQLKEDGFAVVNIDDPGSSKIIKASRGTVVTYGINNQADIRAEEIKLEPTGVSFEVKGKRDFSIQMKLTGLFNVYNTLAAISCGYALGLRNDTIKAGLENVNGVEGRFELVDEGQDFAVVVDYAHTPDGMENVLKTALEFVEGEIIVVFGCGGDRDRGKRPLMGQISARYGNYSVLTSDNPRSEDPLSILREIEEGIKEMAEDIPYKIIPDRKEAIFHAIERARKNDMVIIFGKGHETYQIFKDKTISFDDREVAREAIRNKYHQERNRDDKL